MFVTGYHFSSQEYNIVVAYVSGAETAGAEMSQRREVPAPKRWAPQRWRRNVLLRSHAAAESAVVSPCAGLPVSDCVSCNSAPDVLCAVLLFV